MLFQLVAYKKLLKGFVFTRFVDMIHGFGYTCYACTGILKEDTCTKVTFCGDTEVNSLVLYTYKLSTNFCS